MSTFYENIVLSNDILQSFFFASSSLSTLSYFVSFSLYPRYQRLMVRSNFSSSLTYSSYTCLCGLNRIYTHAWASIKDCQDIRLRFYRWTLNTNLCHISSLYMLGVTNMKFSILEPWRLNCFIVSLYLLSFFMSLSPR